jgi:hypothetical protein
LECGEAASHDIRTFQYQNYRLPARPAWSRSPAFDLGPDRNHAERELAGQRLCWQPLFLNGVDFDSDGTADNQFASNFQEDVSRTILPPGPWALVGL